MKNKHMSILTVFCLVSTLAFAQEKATTTTITTTTVTPTADNQKAVEQAQKAIEIVEAQVAQEQETTIIQPETVVTAQPLTTSSADHMRRSREDAELLTEQRIVEKLEQSRLEDEKRRADALFGGGFNHIEKKDTAVKAEEKKAPQVIVVTTPAEVVAPKVEEVKTAPVAPAPTIEEVKEAVRTELKASIPEKEVKKNRMFMSGQLGMMNYESTEIDTKSSVGFSIGNLSASNFSMEVDFLYSNHYVNDTFWVYREMDQYNLGLTARYNFPIGKIRPNVGLALSYTLRDYSAPRDYADGYSYDFIGPMKSNAFDAGLVTGVSVAVTEEMEIGLEYRYMTNLSYKYENEDELNAPGYRGINQIEDQTYDVWGVSLRYMF